MQPEKMNLRAAAAAAADTAAACWQPLRKTKILHGICVHATDVDYAEIDGLAHGLGY